jgi:quinol monooxygenase YgiN
MTIQKTAEFRVRPETLPACLAAIRELVATVHAQEPGTRLYVSFQDPADETHFLHVMIFEDGRAEEPHRSSAWVKKFVGVLYPCTVDGVRFTDWGLVA